MPCKESEELENAWQKRYERAESVERGGLFALPLISSSHMLMVRQHRAKQAQAANAILMHRRTCPVCSNDNLVQAGSLFESRAS
jgi:cytochrome c-type biogenesis protein CcmH/NrfF